MKNFKTYDTFTSEKIEERNAFLGALAKARANGDKTFELNGKTYPVKSSKNDLNEDDDEITEAKSVNKISGELIKATEALRKHLEVWKKAKTPEAKAKELEVLKDLTTTKKALDAELNDTISSLDQYSEIDA